MPKQPPLKRRGNFDEVALGLSREEALQEAGRCLRCPNSPCAEGCPVNVPIKEFIALVAQEDFAGAASKIKERNSLPSICGRVCPQESQCEAKCVRGKKGEPVAIGSLERFVADWERLSGSRDTTRQTGDGVRETAPEKTRVAVVGSGPAGLTAAADLARYGYRVTLFESLHLPGGVLRYGIPEFRLPKTILDEEVRFVESLGVEVRCNTLVGQTITIEDLWEDGYRAVFVATGAGLPRFLGIPGENLNGVYSANEFLTRANLMRAYDFPRVDTPVKVGGRVAVIGGGNVAMDSARTALRLGAEQVYIVYRRSRDEMPARHEEVENAEEEGIQFHLLKNPVRVLGDDKGTVTGLVVTRMELGEPDASGRRRPVPAEGSEETLSVDTVIVAVGQGPNPLLIKYTPDLKTTERGQIAVDEHGATSIPGVYAGGDITTGAATVIAAMGAGKRAAAEIDRFLHGQCEV